MPAVALAFACLSLGDMAQAGSLYLGPNEPKKYDFADLAVLPKEFGTGEFSFEIWVKPDNRFPVGQTARGTRDQMTHWSASDPKPYSDRFWWLPGNWLLDGHTRPYGMSPNNSREGTFSLQFYGGGRIRWMFSDSGEDMPPGKVYAVQAEPASSVPSLLDGKWHHIVAVRRWRQPSGATLELWVDGTRIDTADIPLRVNMRKFWDQVPHPHDPPELGGWAFGAEVMTAWDVYFTQYEDYKGWVDELRLWSRALSPAEIAAAARGAGEDRPKGLLTRFEFEEGRGASACDSIDPSLCMTLHRTSKDSWSDDNAPKTPKA